MTTTKFNTVWRKSSRSSNGSGQCVEIGAGLDRVGIRDSKQPQAGVLVTSYDEWFGLVAAIKTTNV